MDTHEQRWRAVGAEIREARAAKGLTGAQVAAMSGGRFDQSKLSKSERGVRNFIPYEELAAYAEVLDMDLDILALMAYGRSRPEPGSSLANRTA